MGKRMYVINGKFMADRMQGVVRYARELCGALDAALDKESLAVKMLVPPSAHDVPSYKNIRVEVIGRRAGIAWEQGELGRWLRQHQDATCINLCNVSPIGVKPGITALHDVMYKAHPEFYVSLRNRLSRLYHILHYRYVVKHEKAILTVSQFSKSEIEKYYPTARGKVYVVENAWQHVTRYPTSKDWQEAFPRLTPGKYYFSLATLANNKHGRWIIETAKRNPAELFAIAGKRYEADKLEIPDNLLLLGFISDEHASALIQNCKAFLFPSLYEGFGLPPLEALALGAMVISSNTSSLPEVLGDAAYYIDPMEPISSIGSIERIDQAKVDETLGRYSWEKSARELLELLKQNVTEKNAGEFS